MNEVRKILEDLVRAYEREVNPADNWTQTAISEKEFLEVTKEYRAAKEWLKSQIKDGDTVKFCDGLETHVGTVMMMTPQVIYILCQDNIIRLVMPDAVTKHKPLDTPDAH